jgi:hypothetical protein
MAHDVKMEARYLTENGDAVIYVDLSQIAPLPSGKKWFRLDLQKAGKALGLDFSKLMGSNTQNPTQSLEMLKASGDFTEVGKETVGGVETTHYHGTVDLQRAAVAKGIDKDQIQHLIDAGMATEVPVDVWVDDQGYVRQYSITMKQETAGTTTTSIMTTGMSSFGTPVEVTAPPSDEVFDVTGAAGSGSASKGSTA